jgi:hypothetical protein
MPEKEARLFALSSTPEKEARSVFQKISFSAAANTCRFLYLCF